MNIYFKNKSLFNKISVLFLFFIKLFKFSISSVPIIFTPQLCSNNYCKFTENISYNNHFSIFIIIFNLFIFSFITILILFNYKRELWFLNNPKQLILNKLDANKYIHKTNSINSIYFKAHLIFFFMHYINIILSSIFIIYYHYLDYKTIISIIISITINFNYINYILINSYKSYFNKIPLSFFYNISPSFDYINSNRYLIKPNSYKENFNNNIISIFPLNYFNNTINNNNHLLTNNNDNKNLNSNIKTTDNTNQFNSIGLNCIIDVPTITSISNTFDIYSNNIDNNFNTFNSNFNNSNNNNNDIFFDKHFHFLFDIISSDKDIYYKIKTKYFNDKNFSLEDFKHLFKNFFYKYTYDDIYNSNLDLS